ncbi:hypothetical protein [Mycoplasma sp. P36-A1]|uniref:hypothetical protein n=1 Tax=Mycoplasma sp. P36-A1 TaxID=3252900 RepID=UPI003C30D14F
MAKIVKGISAFKTETKNYIIDMVEEAFPISSNKGASKTTRSEYIIGLVDNALSK